MRGIERRVWSFALAAGLSAVALIWACWQAATTQGSRAELWPPVLAPATAALVALGLRTGKDLQAAELIVENQILHIRPVVTDVQGGTGPARSTGSLEVFVSCFGILVGSTILAFNQGGARLKAVEIGHSSITLTYGAGGRTLSTRVLCPALDDGELARIAESFRYETGVVPTITH